MAKIYVKFNSAVIKEIDLSKEETTFGRKPGNDIVIDNPAISGFHGKVIKDADQFCVEDLNSTNGTFINGQRIKKHVLKNRDQISIARHVLEFVSDESESGTAQKLSTIPSSVPEKKQEDEKPAKPMRKTEPPVAETPKPTEKTVKASQEQSETESNKYEALLDHAESELKEADLKEQAEAPKFGVLKVISGGSGQTEAILKDLVTYIGSSDQAALKIKGILAPSLAAAISKRPEGYFLKAVKPGYPKVDGKAIQEQILLEHGAMIEVGGMTIMFSSPTGKKKPVLPDA